ncbi:MAG: helix-turn-helix domain-containing protein [Stenotrophomonas sp.]
MAKSIHRQEYTALTELLRDIRRSSSLTQVQVSEQLGRSQSFMSDVENGTRRLDIIELRDIARITGTTLAKVVADLEKRIHRLESGTP